jgi:hypothetical protein
MEDLPVLQAPVIEQPAQQQTLEPIRDVQTFWDRLDEVLTLVKTGGGAVNEKIDQILETFPDKENINQAVYKSFIFQPERISISSNNDIIPSNVGTSLKRERSIFLHEVSEEFSSFRVRLQKSLVNVKSIQLLSSVIPNATQNIPNNQVIFFYYRLRTLDDADEGEWTVGTTYYPGDIVTFNANQYTLTAIDVAASPSPPTLNPSYTLINLTGVDFNRPNYYDLNWYRIQVVFLQPTFDLPPEYFDTEGTYNRTFQDYDDLVTGLNQCANDTLTASIPGDISFQYDARLNKIKMLGSDCFNGTTGYYYLPCGYEDRNILTAMARAVLPASPLNGILGFYNPLDVYDPFTSLNLRLGFTWNGLFSDIFSGNIYFVQPPPQYDIAELPLDVWFYMRPADPAVQIGSGGISIPGTFQQNYTTANSYAELVYTSCVRLYCDFALGSTQDSDGEGGLLSIIPINTTNLGVGFYQNNFSNPLTKIPKIISEIGIRMLDDQGQPFTLPNSATVLLELAITYY